MQKASQLYALLIGIDCYFENELPDGGWYPCLGGCVRDITYIEEFLRRKFGLTEKYIYKLTATYTGYFPPPKQHNYKPTEPEEQWPTYKNMVAKFKEITELAQSGDQVYIHYSGHGARATTIRTDLKGQDGLDEGLVPTDIGNKTVRYLRDFELAHLLKMMVDKDLIVTIVLDSCHSGGATRGLGGAVSRGISSIDTTLRPIDSLVAPPEELANTWRSLSGCTMRSLKPASGWLLEPQGYTLLAACRASESAYEYPFNGVERNGALTYWLLDSLKQLGPWLTYKMLYDRILSKIHGQFVEQTPQLQGEGDRIIFGSNQVQQPYSVLVMKVEANRLKVGAGQAAGLRKGAQFAIYPLGSNDFAQVNQRIALVEITELGAVDSWAIVTDWLQSEDIKQGSPAVLLDPANVKLQRVVRLLDNLSIRKTDIEQSVAQTQTGFLRLASDDEPAEFQLTVNEQDTYEIWDSAGKIIRNLRPPIRINEGDALMRVTQRLIHLSKYSSIRELDNRDSTSPLASALTIELLGMQKDYDPVDGRQPQPFPERGILQVGEWTFLSIRNNLEPNPQDINDPSRILNITVLDLQPDWGITQVYPTYSALFEPLNPGQEIVLDLQGGLPGDYEEGIDVLKVFATLETANFRWLELPPLDYHIGDKGNLRSAQDNPLDHLLAAVGESGPILGKRTLNTYTNHSKGWTTASIEIVIKRRT